MRIYNDRWSSKDLRTHTSTFNSKIKCLHNSEIKEAAEVLAWRTLEKMKKKKVA